MKKFFKRIFKGGKSTVEVITKGATTLGKVSASAARKLSKKNHPLWDLEVFKGKPTWQQVVVLAIVFTGFIILEFL